VRLYRLLFGLLERAGVDGERAHGLAGGALRATMALPGARALARRLLGPRDPRLRVQALGRSFPSPLGLAAGVDSSAALFAEFGALGFGFVEVGTVTALPQAGNAGKRVFRLLADRAILNRRGFPNAGAQVAAGRLARRRTGAAAPIVGVNIGKSRAAALEDAERDYRASTRALAPFADYLVLNVSSPNTPGLREMQSTARLRALVGAVREELAAAGLRVPLLVKIAPDVSDAQLRQLAELALELELDGIVAVNTTVDRGVLSAPAALPAGVPDGGISGAPLAARSLEVLRQLRAIVGERVALVSVGGIETARDAWERLLAGATLVQAHTAFVYGGPLWPSRVNRELARLAHAAGAGSVGELIGELAPAAAGEAGPTQAAGRPAGRDATDAGGPPSTARARRSS
jgi:dihydroorotate dehydrogenase